MKIKKSSVVSHSTAGGVSGVQFPDAAMKLFWRRKAKIVQHYPDHEKVIHCK